MKRKGFTLVELLAVIVILAIIALIAVPMILGVIETAKEGAAKSSALGYIDAVEKYMILQELENYSIKLENNTTYKVSNVTTEVSLFDIFIERVYAEEVPGEIYLNDIIKVKGEYPYEGYVKIGEKEIEEAKLTVSGYKLECDKNNCEVIGKDSEIKPTSITIIKPESNTIKPNDTLQLYVEIEPSDATKKVTWTSSDESVATISESGLVTAISEGTVTISATTSNKKTDSIEIKVELPKLCKRATRLHTEECKQTDSIYNYCRATGYTTSGSKGTTTITYGNLGTTGTLTSGDAFTCDVNGDGTFDEETERFYYVSELSSNTEYAVLIYYKNTISSDADDSSTSVIAYDSSNKSYQGPVTAIANLPTTTEWSNVSLSNTSRAITNEKGAATTNFGAIPLPTFSYEGYAARLITAQEINTACGRRVGTYTDGELDGCNYFMESTKYSSSQFDTFGYWLETPRSEGDYLVWHVTSYFRRLDNVDASSSRDNGVRPVIEVLKSNISY